MKRVFIIVSILGSTSVFNASFAKCTVSVNDIVIKNSGAIKPQKTKVWNCAPVSTSCGKDMWACGESASEMLSCAIEAEKVACG